MKRVGDVDPGDVANLQTSFTSWVGWVGKLMKNGLIAFSANAIKRLINNE